MIDVILITSKNYNLLVGSNFNKGTFMFENFEVREIKTGYLVIVQWKTGDIDEYAFDTPRKLTKFINTQLINSKGSNTE